MSRAGIRIVRTATERWRRLPRHGVGPSATTRLPFSRDSGPKGGSSPARPILKGLHARGVRKPLVVAPGFTTDCLETLDELGHEGRHQFASGGGDPAAYRLCPCLNDLGEWIDTMAELVRSATPTKP